jgi:GT2 family glycosyltransferase/glycosyltransferase involved in cell wall biosynthesis
MIDIIIPVFNAPHDAIACLESVLKNTRVGTAQITLIDDASTDPRVGEWLEGLERRSVWPLPLIILRNPENLGFVGTVNRAMALSHHDVVLLNSDTLVTPGWLDRLVECADNDPQTATVTPFSNNAEICSYPQLCGNTPAAAFDVNSLVQALVDAHDGHCPIIPTAMGFCMLIRRRALDQVGLFDAMRFGRGYGEENEFCLRARAAGFVHRLCPAAFVIHHGGRSFLDDTDGLKQRNLAQLLEQHPGYNKEIEKFIADDTLAPVRERVVQWLRAKGKTPMGHPLPPAVLFVTHAMGGGIEKHIQDLIELAGPALRIEILRPFGINGLSLEDTNGQRIFWDQYDRNKSLNLLRARHYQRVHLHHWQGHPPEILKLHRELLLPLDITVHDFGFYCPRNNLSQDDVNYCGEPELSQCEQCIERRPNPWLWRVETWREEMHALLRQAERVIAPSKAVVSRMQKHFPDIRLQVMDHPPRHEWISHAGHQISPVKVLIPGGLSGFKGLHRVVAAATWAQKNELAVFFTIVGYTSDAVPVWPALPLTITGEYPDAQLPQLLALQRADVVWIPGQIPETWSYTLDAALLTGLPILAQDSSGAVSERLLQSHARHHLYPSDAESAEILSALQALVLPKIKMGSTDHLQDQLDRREAYRSSWLSWMDTSGADMTWTPALQSQTNAPDASAIQDHEGLSLQVLFTHGVECGHKQSREALKVRLGELDELEASLQDIQSREGKPWFVVMDQLHLQVGHLKSRIEELQSEQKKMVEDFDQERKSLVQYYESSRSWRLTTPLRAVGRLFRQIPTMLKKIQYISQRGIRQWPMAWRILREQGVVALVSRIQSKLTLPSPPELPLNERIPHWLNTMEPLKLDTCPLDVVPLVTIVIPVYGQHLYTYNCLRSLQENTKLERVEVIVADDASPEPAEAALKAVQGVRWIRHDSNLGFVGNCNAAAADARGQYLLLLNNDVQVTRGWLDALLAVFAQRTDAGLVGARLVYPNGQLQEAGGIVWQDGSAWNWGRLQDPEHPSYRYVRAVDYCSGACLLLCNSDWKQLGGFDASYAPAYYEDTDLAFRIRAMGQKVYYQPEALIVHHEGITSGTDVGQGVKRHQVINQKKFFDRWKTTLEAHRPNGVNPIQEINRHALGRVLVVDACIVRPDIDSGSVRMRALLEIMLDMGLHVTFVADNLEYQQPYAHDLQQLGVEFWHGPHIRSVSELLEKNGRSYDIVVLCRHYIAHPLLHAVKTYAPQARLWFDTVDLHYLREERMAQLEGSEVLREMAAATKRQEFQVMQNSDVTLVVSPVEKNLLAQELPDVKVEILSNIHEPVEHTQAIDQRHHLLFVGGFQHLPNVDAVLWFVTEVWPIVHAAAPEMRVQIVGSQMPAKLQNLDVPGVEMLGFVQDLDDLLSRSRISIAPLRYGAGVKGKINQAMAHGLPVVATFMAVEGMNLLHEEHVLVADTPQDFAREILRLYSDETLWNALVINGKDNIRRTFSRDIAKQTLNHLLGFSVSS